MSALDSLARENYDELIFDDATLRELTELPPPAQCRIITPADASQGARNFTKRICDAWSVHLTYASAWQHRRGSTDYTNGQGEHPHMTTWVFTESVAVRIRDTERGSTRAVVLYIKRGTDDWKIDIAWWWQVNPATLAQPVPQAYTLPQPIGFTELKAALVAGLSDSEVIELLRAGTVAERARQAKKAKKAAATEQAAA